ncbi:hypothetical protein BKG86_17030 [Mycobacteroides chelonae]|uniref:hypothetical protein n=1 Tax=Mycobacteroides chelonae TaxID=1774 RepID=UPI0008A898BB|nr:hypothetical protein [Mycobacteroides chelonae]OHU71357.1 hypothetical protein BKG86_17030 [Mycobacteroides chelonae]
MSSPARPWWADAQVVRENLDRREFDVMLAYLQGLGDLVEAAIAYGPRPEWDAEEALKALEVMTYADYPQRVMTGAPGAFGGRAVSHA